MILGVQTGVTNFRKIGSGELIFSTMESFPSENENNCSITVITPMCVGLWQHRKMASVQPPPPYSDLEKFG